MFTIFAYIFLVGNNKFLVKNSEKKLHKRKCLMNESRKHLIDINMKNFFFALFSLNLKPMVAFLVL